MALQEFLQKNKKERARQHDSILSDLFGRCFCCRLILGSDLEPKLIPKDIWTGQRNKMRFDDCRRAFSFLEEANTGIWSLNPYPTSFFGFKGTLRNFLCDITLFICYSSRLLMEKKWEVVKVPEGLAGLFTTTSAASALSGRLRRLAT